MAILELVLSEEIRIHGERIYWAFMSQCAHALVRSATRVLEFSVASVYGPVCRLSGRG